MPEHIKMPDVTPLVRLVADGIETIFAYPFPIFASEDLRVYIDGALQVSGFTINGAGETTGGSVTFDTAPALDRIATLERVLPLERLTDFLEGGDFSANSINSELDYLVAAIQQVSRENDSAIRYSDFEAPAGLDLPSLRNRKNKVLGFDGSGNPVAVSAEGTMAAPDYTAAGFGAETRSSSDKLSDIVSIRDFGAVGDGLTDDTIAIQQALTAHDSVLVPAGVYLITSTITLAGRKSLFGLGQQSVIRTNGNAFNAIEIPAQQTTLQNLRIEGGDAGVILFGKDAECTQNNISDINLIGPNIGILLDGYNDAAKPCYWNNFDRILIEQPLTHGVHLTLTGSAPTIGDTPNANRFHKVRVYSKGAATSGDGFFVEHGSFNNSFVDCEANMNGTTASSCFRIGAGSNKTLILNLLCEGFNTLPNIVLEAGSIETILINLSAESDGAAILDNSGGNYDAINAGFPDKNRFRKTLVTDMKATHMRYDTEFIDTPGATTLDLSHTRHIVNASGGAIDLTLPSASSSAGSEITVKKVDNTANIITISQADGKDILLGGENDYATMLSNGAEWYITSSNRMPGNTRFIDSSGLIDIDMAVDTYLLSSFGGAMTARLPPANASEAIGRTVTLKKTDPSANVISVTEQGGNGPDQSTQTLSGQYNAITVLSNGGQWYIVNRF